MTRRRKARASAVQVLYDWEVTRQDARKIIVHLKEHFSPGREDDRFLEQLVVGVIEHLDEMDRLIEQCSEHWRLERMAPIDRIILRMALYELLYCEEIPPKVTLNEAIDLAKQYSTEESGSFINGILDRILNTVIQKPTQTSSVKP